MKLWLHTLLPSFLPCLLACFHVQSKQQFQTAKDYHKRQQKPASLHSAKLLPLPPSQQQPTQAINSPTNTSNQFSSKQNTPNQSFNIQNTSNLPTNKTKSKSIKQIIYVIRGTATPSLNQVCCFFFFFEFLMFDSQIWRRTTHLSLPSPSVFQQVLYWSSFFCFFHGYVFDICY